MDDFKKITQDLITELKVSASQKEREELAARLEERFSKLVIDVMAQNLNEAQRQRFLQILRGPAFSQSDQISMLAAEVPGLLEKINQALVRELELIRTYFKNNL